MTRVLALAAATVLAGCGGAAEEDKPKAADAHAAQVAKLTRRQLIGQHMVFAFAGTEPPAGLRKRIARGEAAGVILFARNVRSAAQVRAMTRRLQAIRRPPGLRAPLLVMVDQEGGPVRRIPGAPQRAAAAMTTTAIARAEGRAAARTLRSAGVNVDLAPVVDVGRRGAALTRERRTFPGDAASVTRLAGAFATGLRAGKVAPALKHFPGFGAASVNTDDAPARIDLSLGAMRRADLVPFDRLDAGMVMLSTAVYPRVDPRPAAFSRRWVAGELRQRLGFSGVAITDDLQTPAVAQFGRPDQLAYFALRAGVDLPLFAKDYTSGARAAEGLLRSPLTRKRLEAGARRVLAFRARLAR